MLVTGGLLVLSAPPMFQLRTFEPVIRCQTHDWLHGPLLHQTLKNKPGYEVTRWLNTFAYLAIKCLISLVADYYLRLFGNRSAMDTVVPALEACITHSTSTPYSRIHPSSIRARHPVPTSLTHAEMVSAEPWVSCALQSQTPGHAIII